MLLILLREQNTVLHNQGTRVGPELVYSLSAQISCSTDRWAEPSGRTLRWTNPTTHGDPARVNLYELVPQRLTPHVLWIKLL